MKYGGVGGNLAALRDALKEKLSADELKLVPSSYDIIGNREKAVAIVEIPNGLINREKDIAEAIMRLHKSVKSVLRKLGPRKGILRLREYELIAGDANTEVVHVEAGCRFRLDPQKTYFSQREGTERMRIAEKVKPGETVMVFFAGAGPFAIVIAKKAKPARVIGIEINHDAVRYFEENAKSNKLRNVDVIEGDVRKMAEQFHGSCDRVLMPLPEQAIEYIDDAIKCAKTGGVIHFYCFAKEGELPSIKAKISEAAQKLGRMVEFICHELVLPWGPRIWKMRLDFRVH